MEHKLFRIGSNCRAVIERTLADLNEERALSLSPCFAKSQYVVSFLYKDAEDLRVKLAEHRKRGIKKINRKKLCILFTGQGAQYPGMAKKPYQSNAVVRGAIDHYHSLLQRHQRPDYRDFLLQEKEEIHQTEYTQPCMVIFQMALMNLWTELGVQAEFYIGHSVGEFSACHSVGLYEADCILRMISKRAELMQALNTDGGMIAVGESQERIDEIVRAFNIDLDYAAFNSPVQTVLAGAHTEIERLKAHCKEQKIRARVLSVSHPFHSKMMSPMTEEFKRHCQQFKARPESTSGTIFSNVTGKALQGDNLPEYWSEHILRPVNFKQSLLAAQEQGAEVFLEIGPDAVLTNLAKRTLGGASITYLSTMRKNQSFNECLLAAAVILESQGQLIEWEKIEFFTA